MIYFTSDTHISHERILDITKRGILFNSIEEHDSQIIKNINDTVGDNDILYHLGDIGSRQGIQKFIDEVKCEVRLVFGNHDLKERSAQYFRHHFLQAEHELQVKHDGKRFVLTHYPMLVWDQSFRGSFNLFGHTHANINDWLKQFRPEARMVEVSVDSAFELLGCCKPFSLDDVLSIAGDRRGHSPDANKFWIKDVEQDSNFVRQFNIYYEYDLNPVYLPRIDDSICINGNFGVILDASHNGAILVLMCGDYVPKIGDKVIWE